MPAGPIGVQGVSECIRWIPSWERCRRGDAATRLSSLVLSRSVRSSGSRARIGFRAGSCGESPRGAARAPRHCSSGRSAALRRTSTGRRTRPAARRRIGGSWGVVRGRRAQAACGCVNKGVTLGSLDRSQDAIAVYDELLARFADAPEPALREQVAGALVNKGVTLGSLDRSQDAIAVYDELLARFADAPEPGISDGTTRRPHPRRSPIGGPEPDFP
jgi:hypothetical protein